MKGLVDTLFPALPATAVIAAVAADDGGYAVKLSDACPLDGRFEIGSITKTLTGILLASLADGIVALDDEVGRWLDAGQNSDITVGQLATHTSGLPSLSPGHTTGASDPYDFLTADAAERELRLTASKPRGVEWDYSNFGFQVLSLALERAAGMPFGSLLEERIFQPLEMTCSGVAGYGRGSRIQGHAQGNPVRPWSHHLWGAGGIEATAEDMARYRVSLPDTTRVRCRLGNLAWPSNPTIGSTRYGRLDSDGARPTRLPRSRRRNIRLSGHARNQAVRPPRGRRLCQRPCRTWHTPGCPAVTGPRDSGRLNCPRSSASGWAAGVAVLRCCTDPAKPAARRCFPWWAILGSNQ